MKNIDNTASTKLGTRQRILMKSLMLFNEHGEPNTTTNEIADELDISPGNLHYHFRRKSDLVDALIANFECDVRSLVAKPASESPNIEDFWFFLHMLFERTSAYRFLFRDTETLVSSHPKAAKTVRKFVNKLAGIIAWYLDGLERAGSVDLHHSSKEAVSRNLLMVMLFSERFDVVTGVDVSLADAATRTAEAALQALLPVLTGDARHTMGNLIRAYR